MKLIREINNRKRRIRLNYINALAFNGGGKKAAMSWAMRSVKPNLNYRNHLAKRASDKWIKEHTPPFICNP